MTPDHYRTFAAYNFWANGRVIAACGTLPSTSLEESRPAAFFGSIIATLNHILVGDTLWLSRLQGAPVTMKLDTLLHPLFDDYVAARRDKDAQIAAFVDGLSPGTLRADLIYKNVAGDDNRTPMNLVLSHMFNHQTHHRGQVHALLSDAGAPPPPLDMIYFHREREGL